MYVLGATPIPYYGPVLYHHLWKMPAAPRAAEGICLCEKEVQAEQYFPMNFDCTTTQLNRRVFVKDDDNRPLFAATDHDQSGIYVQNTNPTVVITDFSKELERKTLALRSHVDRKTRYSPYDFFRYDYIMSLSAFTPRALTWDSLFGCNDNVFLLIAETLLNDLKPTSFSSKYMADSCLELFSRTAASGTHSICTLTLCFQFSRLESACVCFDCFFCFARKFNTVALMFSNINTSSTPVADATSGHYGGFLLQNVKLTAEPCNRLVQELTAKDVSLTNCISICSRFLCSGNICTGACYDTEDCFYVTHYANNANLTFDAASGRAFRKDCQIFTTSAACCDRCKSITKSVSWYNSLSETKRQKLGTSNTIGSRILSTFSPTAKELFKRVKEIHATDCSKLDTSQFDIEVDNILLNSCDKDYLLRSAQAVIRIAAEDGDEEVKQYVFDVVDEDLLSFVLDLLQHQRLSSGSKTTKKWSEKTLDALLCLLDKPAVLKKLELYNIILPSTSTLKRRSKILAASATDDVYRNVKLAVDFGVTCLTASLIKETRAEDANSFRKLSLASCPETSSFVASLNVSELSPLNQALVLSMDEIVVNGGGTLIFDRKGRILFQASDDNDFWVNHAQLKMQPIVFGNVLQATFLSTGKSFPVWLRFTGKGDSSQAYLHDILSVTNYFHLLGPFRVLGVVYDGG